MRSTEVRTVEPVLVSAGMLCSDCQQCVIVKAMEVGSGCQWPEILSSKMFMQGQQQHVQEQAEKYQFFFAILREDL